VVNQIKGLFEIQKQEARRVIFVLIKKQIVSDLYECLLRGVIWAETRPCARYIKLFSCKNARRDFATRPSIIFERTGRIETGL